MYRSIFTTALLFSSALSAEIEFAAITPAPDRPRRLIVTLKDTEESGIPDFVTIAGLPQLNLINGFVVNADNVSMAELRADPNVKSVEEDIEVTINMSNAPWGVRGWGKGKVPVVDSPTVTQTDAPWGIARLSSLFTLPNQDSSALDFEYRYFSLAGEGVDVYVVDTGVRTTHEQFEGRATWGATFGGYADADGHGHGTHCAGTVAGKQFGVAKAANIIAVKVLSDGGSGYLSDVLSGLNYVYEQHTGSKNPSVVSMSLGSGASEAVDTAVNNLIAAGVHVVVAAGNSNDDASKYSPARVKNAITVGASDITDYKASFSNYGAGVDVFAPGVDVTSAWGTSDTATLAISGTSMATPHISGLVAYLISIEGNKQPAQISRRVVNLSLKRALRSIPRKTPNRLAHLF